MERRLRELSPEGDEMATNDPTMAIETELARAFDLVSEISERIDDEVLCLDEMDLRFDLLVAEAEGEVVTSAPPAWSLAA